MREYIFVCLMNTVRSPAAANYFSKLLNRSKASGYVKSAGVHDGFNGSVQLTPEMIKPKTKLFVMDDEVMQNLEREDWFLDYRKKQPDISDRIVVLGIPDAFDRMTHEFSIDQLGHCRLSDEKKKAYIQEFEGKTLDDALELRKDVLESKIMRF